MKVVSSALVLVCALFLSNLVVAEERQVGAEVTKPNAARLVGMKEALADIEQGKLKLKSLPACLPWAGEYDALLKKECGVEVEMVDGGNNEGMAGYNDVMTAEIEHRFGKDVLMKLNEQAMKEFQARSKAQ